MTFRNLVCMWALLGVVCASSVSAAEYGGGVDARVVFRSTTTSNGARIAYPVTDRPEVTAMTVTLAPGAETGWHSHPVPVYAWMLEGELTVEVEGGKQYHFKAGDPIIEVVNTRHNGRNTGKVPAKLAVFYTGVEGRPSVVRTPAP